MYVPNNTPASRILRRHSLSKSTSQDGVMINWNIVPQQSAQHTEGHLICSLWETHWPWLSEAGNCSVGRDLWKPREYPVSPLCGIPNCQEVLLVASDGSTVGVSCIAQRLKSMDPKFRRTYSWGTWSAKFFSQILNPTLRGWGPCHRSLC